MVVAAIVVDDDVVVAVKDIFRIDYDLAVTLRPMSHEHFCTQYCDEEII